MSTRLARTLAFSLGIVPNTWSFLAHFTPTSRHWTSTFTKPLASQARSCGPSRGYTTTMCSAIPPSPDVSGAAGSDFDSWFWGDAHVRGGVEHAVFKRADSAVVLFDGECNFCNSGVWMMIANSDERNMRFCAQNSEMGLSLLRSFGQDQERLSSIAVLDKDGHLHTQSDAVVEILARMQFPYPLLSSSLKAVPQSIRDAAYHWVSVRRHMFGSESNSCRIPEDDEAARFVV